MPVLAALSGVITALEQLGVAYRIGGSVASSAHGVPRSTVDVDVVAALRPEHVRPLCLLLESSYLAEAELLQLAIDTGTSCNFIHFASAYKIDLFVRGDRPFDLREFERGCRQRLCTAPDGREYDLATAEDIVLRKLQWYRTGGEVRETQWLDVLGVLRVQYGKLDLPYLQRWAAELQIDDLLQRAMDEAGDG